MKTTVADLYRGELNVWVEDHLTHAVLTDVWADPRINVLVAAGKDGVRHMVKAAAPRYAAVVYGLLDRDFDDDDKARWEQPERRLLRFPAHEFENLLLDFDLLSELSGSHSAAEIRACAKERAQRLLWWMSCKAVLRRIRADLADNFLSDPPQPGSGIDERGEALQHLQSRRFWEQQAKALQGWTQVTIEAALDERARYFESELTTDAWSRSFSGKELLRHLRGQVRGLDVTPPRPPQPTASDRDENLGKRLARLMRAQGKIPTPLVHLRDVLWSKARMASAGVRPITLPER